MTAPIHPLTLTARSPLDYYARPSMDAGPSRVKRHSAISRESTLCTATDEPSTPPRTPSSSESNAKTLQTGSIPLIHIDELGGGHTERSQSSVGRSSKDADSGPEGKSKLRRRRSEERTRTWAEEVERQRMRAEKLSEKKRDQREKNLRLAERGKGPLANSPREESFDIMESFQDELGSPPATPLYSNTLSTASHRSTRSPYLSSSDEDNDEPPTARVGPSRREPSKAPKDTSKSPSSLRSPTSMLPSPIKTQTYSAPLHTPISSIDDIVKRHQMALNSAMCSAKVKARLEMGLSPTSANGVGSSPSSSSNGDTKPLVQVSTSPSGDHSLEQGKSVWSPPINPSKHPQRVESLLSPIDSDSALSPTKSFFMSGSSRRSRPVPPLKIAKENVVSDLGDADLSPISSDLPRTSNGRTDASGGDSLTRDLLMGQQLLQQLDQTSASSVPTPSQHPSSIDGISITPSKRQSVRRSKTSETPEGHSMALYLRSPNLNRYLQLPRPYPDRPLSVSLAEVGSPTGAPVLVFLGLGCVRYLIALFDDLAKALDLRLICIDRWGYGKTDPVPPERRQPILWAHVVEKVMDEMRIKSFRVVAHSAGTPFAAAIALRMGERVKGKMQLLAPWVSPEIDGGYKWLKWIPNGVIKSATAAEWKLQTYLLGKPPLLVHQPVGHIAEARTPSPSPGRPSLSHRPRSDVTPAVPFDALLSPSPKPTRAPSVIRRASNVFTRTDSIASQAKERKGSPIIKHLRGSVLLRSHSDEPAHRSPLETITPRQSIIVDQSTPISKPILNDTFSPAAIEKLTDEPHEGDMLEFLADGFSITALPSPAPTPTNRFSSSPLPTRQVSTPTPSIASTENLAKPELGPALTQALMQASHAECEPGTTTEILTIVLNRAESPWGFSYTDLVHPVVIHWGEEDDKVSEKSVRWMERSMIRGGAELRVIPGEGHNLLTSAGVMCDLFEEIQREVSKERRERERERERAKEAREAREAKMSKLKLGGKRL